MGMGNLKNLNFWAYWRQ